MGSLSVAILVCLAQVGIPSSPPAIPGLPPGFQVPKGFGGQDPKPFTSERDGVEMVASTFFMAFVRKTTEPLTQLIVGPTYIEGHYYESADEARSAWLRIFEARRNVHYELRGLVVLSPAEMEAKYGKPPARLAAMPWKAPHTYIVVANLSGHPAVLLIRGGVMAKQLIVGFTD